MASPADRWLHVASRIGWVRSLQRRARFPGLGMAATANLSIDGTLSYGRGCTIGEGANILVPRGASLRLGEECYVGRHVEIGPSGAVSIGTRTSIQDRSILVGDVTVGRYCLISLNVLISSGRHYFDLKPSWLIQDQDAYVRSDAELAARHSRPVVIEDDCWIGVNSVIMPGVTIGKGAVVGAGSLVMKDVPPYTVVGGTPARVVKQRLEFVPPRRIIHDNERDWPYFYRGFELSQASLARNAPQGGVAARDEFVLCLNSESARELHIVAKSLDGPAVLTVGGTQQPVAGDFRELVFEREQGETREPWLRIRATATVIVKEAWVQ